MVYCITSMEYCIMYIHMEAGSVWYTRRFCGHCIGLNAYYGMCALFELMHNYDTIAW